ncbi:hypothetical protein NGF19_00550 [Streptomyces sp. RY43-2]|uniref:Gram-positive cocci surface proteins LPxTG domain-containing protein n=1 Tax=Streptomyces macrolidinus TaxID=2952607 RepID=A0ABT0Z765_9ACTN|nr:hypothetical protein [Streptomyces macrolidinus]MCN9239292.1 hypothetical protein [Streptomyces macrolidinus]
MRLPRTLLPSRLSHLPRTLLLPRLPLFLACALAAVVFFLQASVAALPADSQPTCAAPTGNAFPLTTHIRGGPDRYRAGGDDHTWFIDLKNTTTRSCAHIHPVVVLVDTHHALTAEQPKLEFFEGDRAHPVALRRTDRSELVGAFDDGFAGFTVAPGKTVSVKVRLALAPDARQNDVVANAAIVQRRGDDGSWVGESNEYRFRIEPKDDEPKDDEADGHDAHKKTPHKKGAGKESPGTASPGTPSPGTASPGKGGEGKKGAGAQHKQPGTASPSPRPSPSGSAPAHAGQRVAHRLDPLIGGLLMVAGGVLVAGSPFLLHRARR